MERLRRFPKGADQYVKGVFARDLMQALDKLGIEPGDEFVVMATHEQQSLLDQPPPQTTPNSELESGPASLADLDGSLGPFSKDSETSRQAALQNYPKSGTQRHKVLVAIGRSGAYGRTRDELASELGLPDSGTDARVWELLRGGFVREDGDRTRETQAKAQASVLVLTDKGIREFNDVEVLNVGR